MSKDWVLKHLFPLASSLYRFPFFAFILPDLFSPLVAIP